VGSVNSRLFQISFSFDFSASYAMRFIPVQFRQANVAIVELYARGAFALSPVSGAVGAPQPRNLADARSFRNCFGVRNPSQDAEVHRRHALQSTAKAGLQNACSPSRGSSVLCVENKQADKDDPTQFARREVPWSDLRADGHR